MCEKKTFLSHESIQKLYHIPKESSNFDQEWNGMANARARPLTAFFMPDPALYVLEKAKRTDLLIKIR